MNILHTNHLRPDTVNTFLHTVAPHFTLPLHPLSLSKAEAEHMELVKKERIIAHDRENILQVREREEREGEREREGARKYVGECMCDPPLNLLTLRPPPF